MRNRNVDNVLRFKQYRMGPFILARYFPASVYTLSSILSFIILFSFVLEFLVNGKRSIDGSVSVDGKWKRRVNS